MLKQNQNFARAKKNGGYTLIELAVATALAASVVAGSAWVLQEQRVARATTSTAPTMKAVGIAVDNYTAQFAYELRDGLPVPGVANPYQPTIAELRTLGYFNTGFDPTRLPGGNMQTVITRVPAGCVGEACNLEWLSHAAQPLTRMNNPDEALAGQVVKELGSFAGYSRTDNPAVFRGYNDTWNPGVGVANPTGQAGIIAMRGGYGTSVFAKFLRIDGGNQMTGNFRGGGHNITGVNNATISGNVDVTGTQTNRSTLRVMGAQTNDSTLSVASNATVGGALGVGGQATMYSNVRVVGTQINDRSLTVGEHVQASAAGAWQFATLNTSCSGVPQGSMKADAAGKLLSCQSGLWKAAAGGKSVATLQGLLDAYATRSEYLAYSMLPGTPATSMYEVMTTSTGICARHLYGGGWNCATPAQPYAVLAYGGASLVASPMGWTLTGPAETTPCGGAMYPAWSKTTDQYELNTPPTYSYTGTFGNSCGGI